MLREQTGQGALFQDHMLCKWHIANCTMFRAAFCDFYSGLKV